MLDQSEITALWDHCFVMGHVNLFSPSFQKLYLLLADDRDWQPGEVQAANWYIADVLKPVCDMIGKVKCPDDLECVQSCPWRPCWIKDALRG